MRGAEVDSQASICVDSILAIPTSCAPPPYDKSAG